MKLLYFLSIFLISFSLNCKTLDIEKIEFHGLKSINQKIILKKFKKAETTSPKDFFKKLINTNIFDYIKIKIKNKILLIHVIEKPYIKSIKLNYDKKNKFILKFFKKSKIRVGKLYDYSRIDLLKSKLEHYYFKKGFYNVKIEIKTKFNKNLNFVDIEVNILKNNLIRIRNVIFTGNKIFTQKRLLNKTRFHGIGWLSWFSRNNVFIKSRLRADIRKLKRLYINRGYASFLVNYAKLYLNKKGQVFVTIDLFEGERHEFGRIILEGGIFIEPVRSRLIKILSKSIKSGKRFSIDTINNTRTRLANFFGNNGYINTKVSYKIINIGRKSIDIVFHCEISPRIKARKIIFKGNRFTSENVLKKFIHQKEADIISTKKINAGRQEIIKREVTKKVGVSYVNCKKRGELDIILKLKEKKASKFTAGFTYVKGSKPMLNLVAEMSNFFGSGNDLTINMNQTKTVGEYHITYINSRFLGGNYDVNYNIHMKTEDFNKKAAYFDYASDLLGAYIEYQFYLSLHSQFNIGLGVDYIKLKLYEDRAPVEVKKFIGKKGISYDDYYFTMGTTKNTLNRMVFPNRGFVEHINFKVSVPGSNLSYFQFNYDINYYTKIHKNLIGIYTNICYGNTLVKSVKYPFFKYFLLRGPNNIRGFKERSLGPKDSNNENIGGNLMICSKIFLYLKLPVLKDNPLIRTSIFMDIGQSFNTDKFSNKPVIKNKKIKYNSFLRASIGFCITWHTPFGIPIECSLAYPLNASKTDKIKMISVVVGV